MTQQLTQFQSETIDEEKVSVKYTGQPKLMSKHRIMQLFDANLFSPKTYAVMALWFEEECINGAFDLIEFIDRWETLGPDGGKPKRLTQDQLIAGINALEKCNVASSVVQMQMTLDFKNCGLSKA